MINQLKPTELSELMENGSSFRLIDVREEWEFRAAKLDGAELIPLNEFLNCESRLNENEKIIIYCHHGIRSYSACAYLKQKGFKDVYNLQGGIDAWSRDVDSKIPIY